MRKRKINQLTELHLHSFHTSTPRDLLQDSTEAQQEDCLHLVGDLLGSEDQDHQDADHGQDHPHLTSEEEAFHLSAGEDDHSQDHQEGGGLL